MSDDGPLPFMQALNARATEALANWDLCAQTPQLLKYRENAVFRVTLGRGEPAALRLHRPGYHNKGALVSELSWMEVLREAGLRVPAPVSTPDGRQIVALAANAEFGDQYSDIVSWMTGIPLGQSGVLLAYPKGRLVDIFHTLGKAMARMHTASDAWKPPPSFSRPCWDDDGLLGESPLWGRFWDCSGLLPDEAERLSGLRPFLRERLGALSGLNLDYGLVHADLVRENVLIDGDQVELIDFDDGGYGWRMFDIATALFKNRGEPHYECIQAALIEGYRGVRSLPDSALETLPLFMVLRSITYIGWIGERIGTPDAATRLRRYVADALALADNLKTGASI